MNPCEADLVVRSLVRNYYRALDGSELDAWLATFEPAGRLIVSGRLPLVGADDLRSYWDLRPERTRLRKHIVTDTDVLECADEEINSRVAVLTLSIETGQILAVGSSEDALRRGKDGVWRYSSKEFRMDFRDPGL
jgi:hypothetical protein